jgi:hypothetical protein
VASAVANHCSPPAAAAAMSCGGNTPPVSCRWTCKFGVARVADSGIQSHIRRGSVARQLVPKPDTDYSTQHGPPHVRSTVLLHSKAAINRLPRSGLINNLQSSAVLIITRDSSLVVIITGWLFNQKIIITGWANNKAVGHWYRIKACRFWLLRRQIRLAGPHHTTMI